jgi:TIR domain
LGPVFVSHSSAQRELAAHVARFIERHDIPCWLAPRDIAPGQDFDQAILSAIASCSAILLLFSDEADESTHIRRELNLADDAKKFLLTIRVRDVLPRRLAYWLNLGQRIDWFDRRDETLETVVERLRTLRAGGAIADPLLPHPKAASPERVVEPKIAADALGFAPKLTVETAVYMGLLFPGTGLLSRALNSTFGAKRKVDRGFHVRNFDWKDDAYVRPCDVHLGVDRWDTGDGTHKMNLTYSNESRATTYAVMLGDGMLFGNGNTLLFGGEGGAIRQLAGNTNGAFAVDAGRTRAAWIDDRSNSIRSVRKERHRPLEAYETSLPPSLRWRGWEFLLYLDPKGWEQQLFYFGSSLVADEAAEERPLARIAASTGEIEALASIPKLQNVTASMSGETLAAVTGDCIVFLDADRLQLIDKIPIRETREDNY